MERERVINCNCLLRFGPAGAQLLELGVLAPVARGQRQGGHNGTLALGSRTSRGHSAPFWDWRPFWLACWPLGRMTNEHSASAAAELHSQCTRNALHCAALQRTALRAMQMHCAVGRP